MLDGKEALLAPAPTHANGREKESGSFEEFLRYGTIAERPKRLATLSTYLYAVRRFERYLGERAPTLDLAKGFIAHLEKTISPSSLNVYIAALISYFHFLGQELAIPRFGTHEDNPPILSGGEWQWLLTTATEPVHDPGRSGYGHFRALFELCVLCVYCDSGLRPSEAICLKADDVLNEGYLRVTHSDGNIERVPISGTALKHIKDYIYYRGDKELYLFPGERQGTHMAHRTAQGIVKRLFRRAGLPEARARSLRYRMIRQLRKMGVSGMEMKTQIGSETP